ncbi:MAG TPA: hypothetical protein VFI66_02755 [Gemmatimonadales bacterium]|nr:hypothetical protein [Gemmatimonadales bacterium]
MRFLRNNAIALTALVFAFTGTGLAASHYIITSTKQIKPSVLRKLHGARGAKGPAGAQGKEGAAGKQGATGAQGKEGAKGEQGPAGPFPTTLPVGHTLTGVYDAEGYETSTTEPSFAGDSISFAYPLATAPNSAYLKVGEKTANCPGSASEPTAASGWLCVYEDLSKEAKLFELGGPAEPFARFGDFISFESETVVGGFFSTGSWAVTGD